MVTKKDKVRRQLLKLQDKSTFTISSLASDCGVSTKDVSNVTNNMFKHGVLERETKDGVHIYKVDANAINLYMAKYPQGMPGENGAAPKKAAKPSMPGNTGSNGQGTRKKKRRSPVLVEIDNKIVSYNQKIADLKVMRKEFV